jgi:drug/metabolite transporter (DMT)-like permease
MSVFSALLAALSNAINVVTQHIASTDTPDLHGWKLVVHLFKSPLWLLGWLAIVAAFVFQSLALYWGQLSVVQPLLVTELVFALVLRWLFLHQGIRVVTWMSAALTCVGLAFFLVAAEPQGGTTHPTGLAWITATIASLVAVTGFVLLARHGSRRRRAALVGTATAIMWALVAAIIKQTTESFALYGMGAFAHWPVYALAVTGLTAEVLNQAALHVGPLSMSQPFLVTVDPLAAIVLSIWIFGESFTPHTGSLVLGILSFAGMCAGVFFLVKTAPTTMEADPPRHDARSISE